jgi:hypothetical protein
MVQLTSIEHEWRTLRTERGLAQGRPLSPALAAILLQPCIAAAWEAMKADQGQMTSRRGG